MNLMNQRIIVGIFLGLVIVGLVTGIVLISLNRGQDECKAGYACVPQDDVCGGGQKCVAQSLTVYTNTLLWIFELLFFKNSF